MIIQSKVTVELKVTLEISEGEARALNALACYGEKEFIKVFYEKLGKVYLEPYEKDLKSFLEKVRTTMPSVIDKVDTTRSNLLAHAVR